jgi:hypothetical protein
MTIVTTTTTAAAARGPPLRGFMLCTPETYPCREAWAILIANGFDRLGIPNIGVPTLRRWATTSNPFTGFSIRDVPAEEIVAILDRLIETSPNAGAITRELVATSIADNRDQLIVWTALRCYNFSRICASARSFIQPQQQEQHRHAAQKAPATPTKQRNIRGHTNRW